VKKFIKERPAYAKVPVLVKEDRFYTLEDVSEERVEVGFEELVKERTEAEYRLLTEEYHRVMSEEAPGERIVTLQGLVLSHADALEHVKRQTDVGKWLVSVHKSSLLDYIFKRLREEP
jgi:CBS domain containing-hemolysin-like protein